MLLFMVDFVIISLSTDNVKWSEKPVKLNINGLLKIGIVLGLLMAIEALGLLYIGLNYLHLNTDDDLLSTFCFEILFFFALFTIFVSRERNLFWKSAPSKLLLFLVVVDMILGVIFSTYGLFGLKAIPLTQTAFVFFYTAVFSFIINDYIKFIFLKKWVS